ncbi:chaperone protein dnaJ 20, chloroplastic-like [Lotus japonicus]|uniref:chaperone protein dnaJ 20, chloroplastic-like n=1 Tax=Lotus japonicus TaxID=34305 RepID=UPI00258D8591|nr:chaperone protein dnaJ 20, chloroplastic-like [Lotus japonicus]
MDVLSLSSSLSISKPLHSFPHSSKQQRTFLVNFAISCRGATKLKEETTHGNLYKVLSLKPGSAMDEIKRAYRSMALQYHPDVCHDPSMKEESTKMFVQLNEAYKTLSNPLLREQYDSELGFRSEMNINVSDEGLRSMWQEQVVHDMNMKTKSRRRMGQKGGSWSSRMKTQNMENKN